MGINLPVVLYTHTDMKDIWPMVFGQIKKYLSDFKIYIVTNADDDSIPTEFVKVIYDDTQLYTDRLQQALTQIPESVFLFFHEDMVLLDYPDTEMLELYTDIILSKKARTIKLIYAGTAKAPSYIHPTLVSNELSKFSIQPTIITKDTFKGILDMVGSKSIWDLESAISWNVGDFMAYLGTETKRGMFHYDSKVFPYIATAINKGKWNYTEYKQELDSLFAEYGVDINDRGFV